MMKLFFPLMILVITSASCHKFLDVKPKGVVLPETVEDFENVLNSETLTLTFPSYLLFASDDVYTNYSTVDISEQANAYFWKPRLDRNTDLSPAIWGPAYRCIYNTNVIINNIMQATNGSEGKKLQVLGEALTMRADNYFTLLTAFCKPFDSRTAADDPGLPIVTGIDVTETAPPRSTLQVTIDTIVSDLTTAIDLLPENAINKSRVTKYIAAAALARVYLYTGDFINAGKYAGIALEAEHLLRNFNDFSSVYEFPVIDLDPEVLWLRLSEDLSAPYNMGYSDDLVSYFDENDLRFQFLAYTSPDGTTPLGPDGWSNFGIVFPELYLILAESLARNDDIAGAMDIINMIRSKRILSSAYSPFTASDKEDAVQKVLDERRRELAFRGQRFADMKRLSVEERMPEIKRINKSSGETLVTLAPQSPHYVFEIPARVLLFNKNMQTNF